MSRIVAWATIWVFLAGVLAALGFLAFVVLRSMYLAGGFGPILLALGLGVFGCALGWAVATVSTRP